MAANMRISTKICLIGPEKVGITSIMHFFQDIPFSDEHIRTTSDDVAFRHIQRNGIRQTLQLWDIPKTNSYQASLTLKETDQIVICFDASAEAKATLEQLQTDIRKIRSIMRTLELNLAEDMPITILGCKDDERKESFDASQIMALAKQELPNARSVSIIFSSAKNGTACKVMSDGSLSESFELGEIIKSLAETSVKTINAKTASATAFKLPAAAADHNSGATENSGSYLGTLFWRFWGNTNNRTGEHNSLFEASTSSTTPSLGR